jgi:hypothetical protein
MSVQVSFDSKIKGHMFRDVLDNILMLEHFEFIFHNHIVKMRLNTNFHKNQFKFWIVQVFTYKYIF